MPLSRGRLCSSGRTPHTETVYQIQSREFGRNTTISPAPPNAVFGHRRQVGGVINKGGNMPHECEVFRREDDIDAMREFAAWLRNGGMDSLREMSAVANSVRTAQKVGFVTIVGLIVTGAGTALWLGIQQAIQGK